MNECTTCGVIAPYVKQYVYAHGPEHEDFEQVRYFCPDCVDEDWVAA